MPTFVWKGKSRSGQVQEGVLLADNRNAAAASLRRQQVQIMALKEKGREIPFLPGLPLVQCLEILGGQQEHRKFREVIEKVRSDVESGASLADAMQRQPAAFDDLFVNMVAAGEAGGILDIILQRLALYLEKSVKLKGQVQAALIYPVTIITIAVFVVWIILWKVIPVFAQLFAGLGGELPFLTRAVVDASNFVGRYSLVILAVIVMAIFAGRSYGKTHRGRRVFDSLLLKVPVIGMLLRKIAVARFCRPLATLTASGVPILDGLEITAKTAGNSIIEDAILAVRKSVEEGKTLSGPLEETKIFPSMVVQMINVGEQTGALDQMLSKIADFYEEEVDTAVAGLVKLLEPLMIVVLGGIIGVIVTAMYLPLYTILGSIS